MSKLNKLILPCTALLLGFSSSCYAAAEAAPSSARVDDGRPLVLVDPSASAIIRSHEQRVVNIEYEMAQVMDLINQYSAYKRRLEAGVTALPKEMNTKTLQVGIDREIEKYWKLYNLLSSGRDMLKDSPPLKIKMQKGYKEKK